MQSQNVRRAARSQLGFRYGMMLQSYPIFATVLSLSLAISFEVGYAAFATTSSAKHKVVRAKDVAPAVHSSTVVRTAPARVAPPEASLPANRIHNMMLPVPTITERLIRDIMVGKPQETPPPAGTEAFSNEEGTAATAANGQPASGQAAQVAPAQSAGDAASQTPQVAPAQSAGDAASQTSQVAPAQSAGDAASLPVVSGAETAPAGEAPAGMAPDAVLPLKQEMKPEETEKPHEKSALPFGNKMFEVAQYGVIPVYRFSFVAAAFGPAEPSTAMPQQCAAPSLHALLGDTRKQSISATAAPSESRAKTVAAMPASTAANAEKPSEEFDSAGASPTPAVETQAAKLPLAEPARERIAVDDLEKATYAIKTNGGFGSAMVSRQSIPIETATQPVTKSGLSNTAKEAQEIDLDSAVAPAASSNEETVVDAATSPFNSAPAPDASLIAGTSAKIHDQVLPEPTSPISK